MPGPLLNNLYKCKRGRSSPPSSLESLSSDKYSVSTGPPKVVDDAADGFQAPKFCTLPVSSLFEGTGGSASGIGYAGGASSGIEAESRRLLGRRRTAMSMAALTMVCMKDTLGWKLASRSLGGYRWDSKGT